MMTTPIESWAPCGKTPRCLSHPLVFTSRNSPPFRSKPDAFRTGNADVVRTSFRFGRFMASPVDVVVALDDELHGGGVCVDESRLQRDPHGHGYPEAESRPRRQRG